MIEFVSSKDEAVITKHFWKLNKGNKQSIILMTKFTHVEPNNLFNISILASGNPNPDRSAIESINIDGHLKKAYRDAYIECVLYKFTIEQTRTRL